MKRIVDLSSEMGEGFVLPPLGIDLSVIRSLELGESHETFHERHGLDRFDQDLMPYLSSVSLACGMHSGDPVLLQRLIPQLVEKGIKLGAHPSYPDLFRFGQKPMDLSLDELEAVILYQLGGLSGVLAQYGQKIQHVKCHGGLYFQISYDIAKCEKMIQAIKKLDSTIFLVLLAGSPSVSFAQGKGIRIAKEGFVDRGYDDTGRLLPRNHPGALILDPEVAARRMVEMVVHRKLTSHDGKELDFNADTYCLHSDTPGAGMIASAVSKALREEGVHIRPLADVLNSH